MVIELGCIVGKLLRLIAVAWFLHLMILGLREVVSPPRFE